MLTDADTIGRKNGRITPNVITMTPGPLPVNTMMNPRRKKMSKLYKCPMWDCNCPYFCKRDKEGEGDFGLCLMQEMEGCSPVNECEAFDGVDEEDFEV